MINKIKGRQGSWFADTPIGELPVLKGECWQTNGYRDPHRYNTDSARDRKYVEAVKAGIVVIARYQEMPEGAPRRVGYLGRHNEYFLVDNVNFGEDSIVGSDVGAASFGSGDAVDFGSNNTIGPSRRDRSTPSRASRSPRDSRPARTPPRPARPGRLPPPVGSR